jgi:hypothetical protein
MTSPAPFIFTLATMTVLSSRPVFYVCPPYFQPFITRRHPSGIGTGKPVIIAPFGGAPVPVPPVPKLNWDQDPRLAKSMALQALGWAL